MAAGDRLMGDLPTRQKEALQNPVRSEIYESLRGQEKPHSLGWIGDQTELPDLARVHYHLSLLVDVELVEKVAGTNLYRAVGE